MRTFYSDIVEEEWKEGEEISEGKEMRMMIMKINLIVSTSISTLAMSCNVMQWNVWGVLKFYFDCVSLPSD